MTYIHTLFATPQRGFSVTKGMRKIKIRQLKWINTLGKESKINYSIKNLKNLQNLKLNIKRILRLLLLKHEWAAEKWTAQNKRTLEHNATEQTDGWHARRPKKPREFKQQRQQRREQGRLKHDSQEFRLIYSLSITVRDILNTICKTPAKFEKEILKIVCIVLRS